VSQRRLGITYALIAYGIWGVLPLYLKALRGVPPLEVVAHRIVWSAALLLVVVTVGRQRDFIAQLRARPRIIGTFMASALALSVNWLVYIWAVGQGRLVDGSLGYFINPLFSVVLAVVVLKERLRTWQWAAVALAALGVVWLTLLVGQLPWIGLTLAASFGTYGLLRKTASIDALGGLTLETLLLLPLASLYLLSLSASGHGAWTVAPLSLRTLLVAAGPITAVPLLCFAAGARRIPLSLVGILQYLGPTLQLGLGVFVFHEPLPLAKLAGFALIWLALVLYALEGALFSARPVGPVSRYGGGEET
jgi:chloramphenicol-sensitive protein RarD